MRRTVDTGVIVLGVVGSIASIYAVWAQWTGQYSPEAIFAITLFALFSVALLLLIVAQEYRYSRKARYAEALGHISRIVLLSSSLNNNQTAEEIRHGCMKIVDTLESVLTLVTATRCSVCIKVIQSDPSTRAGAKIRPKVATLCRDSNSLKREKSSIAGNIDHWIDQNTDFEDLHKGAGTPRWYFFSNYLPGRWDYKNSSFEIYGMPWNAGGIPIVSSVIRDLKWTLPYKSTIVVPIVPETRVDEQNRGLSGYLCVDSRSRGAFSRRYDVDLMTGVADSLDQHIRRYAKLKWEQSSPL